MKRSEPGAGASPSLLIDQRMREAGLVESIVDAQRRLYRLTPGPIREIDDWLAPFRRFWSDHVDALERHLDTMARARRKPGRNR